MKQGSFLGSGICKTLAKLICDASYVHAGRSKISAEFRKV